MNESRHEKAWNDPPLFSVDQMSRATNPTVISRRNRYPQQPANPSMNPMNNQMNNPMISTNPMNGQSMESMNPMNGQPMVSMSPQSYGINPMSNQQSFGQTSNQFANQPSYGQPLQQSNAYPNQSYGQPSQQTNSIVTNAEPVFDVNAFMYSIQTLIGSSNHLPQELVIQWQNIQNHLYGIPLESQTKVYFQSILISLQTKDLNNCRVYANYLTNESNQTIRNIASILSQIFRYFP